MKFEVPAPLPLPRPRPRPRPLPRPGRDGRMVSNFGLFLLPGGRPLFLFTGGTVEMIETGLSELKSKVLDTLV